MLIINFSINWKYLESSCFYFLQMPRKMTNFGLNDIFENMKLFLKRASSSDQIKSSIFFSLQFYIQVVEVLHQGLGTYGSRARCRCSSFDHGIWLAWYFLNTIVTEETFSVIFLQIHQQHHAVPEVALTVRSMLLKRKFRHLPLFKIVDFAKKMHTLVKLVALSVEKYYMALTEIQLKICGFHCSHRQKDSRPLCYTMSAKNPTVSLSLSFPKKAEMP